jgi:hypothetical protein
MGTFQVSKGETMCSSRQSRDVTAAPSASASPELRASDADRERVVEMLRDHGASGRLTTEELEERADRALVARTHGELDALLTDLPALPDRRRKAARREAAWKDYSEHLRTYLMVMALLVTIWALTGMGYFWPVWPALGWGIGIASHRASLPRGSRPRRAIAGA